MVLASKKISLIAEQVIAGISERLSWMSAKPANIYCVGFDKENLETMLKQSYPETVIISDNPSVSSVDWVLGHFALPYVEDIVKELLLWQSYLKPDGLLFCTHFGPDTLQEWEGSSAFISPKLLDMHHLGDLLLKTGYTNPVIDVDYYYTRHRSLDNYLQELKETTMLTKEVGVENIPKGKELLTTYEVVFAHAFKRIYNDDTEVVAKIPVSSIKKR